MIDLCVVTGSRADYGLLKPVIHQIKEDTELQLQLIATGMHMDTRFGLTYQEIEKDSICIDEKITVNLATDTSTGISKSIGIAMISFSDAYERLKPDMVLLLGDRYEIFAAAAAAAINRIPIAHIHGGELTQGAWDDWIRHAISKMSYLHFTSTEEYRQRVIQLGEEPERVFNVGALGIDAIKSLNLFTKHELGIQLNRSFNQPFVLVTYHPATLEQKSIPDQITPLFEALDYFPNLSIVFTKSNSDAGGILINQMIDEYVRKNPERAAAYTSLGSPRYLSLMKYCQAVIGNSSSGIIEAPFLKTASVNIGLRQKGRIKPASVLSCNHSAKEIISAIQKALIYDKMAEIENPYEKPDTGRQIISIIKQTIHNGIFLTKKFYDVNRRL